jgi:hypothetical protein
MTIFFRFSMKIQRNWYLLLAVALSAAFGTAIASKLRRRQQLTAHPPEHAPELKSWENEGGNLAPAPATSILP